MDTVRGSIFIFEGLYWQKIKNIKKTPTKLIKNKENKISHGRGNSLRTLYSEASQSSNPENKHAEKFWYNQWQKSGCTM